MSAAGAGASDDASVIVEVIGRADFPTDGVADYSRLLHAAMEARGVRSAIVNVRWEEVGRVRALRDLWRVSGGWQQQPWALAQYTALMWSRRGFPLLFFVVLCVLKLRGVHIAVVFHDAEPYRGERFVDTLRWLVQRSVMRLAYRLSEKSIFNVPVDCISWLPSRRAKASFVPIGANLPVVADARNGCEAKTIAVFTVTDGGDISREVSAIARSARRTAERFPVRLVTVGRGSSESQANFRQALEGSAVEYAALGIRPAQDVAQVLAGADVSLFVRGALSTNRGSAIASIANAVPLVAYADRQLPAPLAEAGVLAVPHGDAEQLARATLQVLADRQLSSDLQQRSRHAYQKYFSWDAVAGRLLEVLESA